MSRRHRKGHPCPTAAKTPYSDRIAAELALARIVAEPGPPREKMPVRAYRCECGRWHLTSQEKAGARG